MTRSFRTVLGCVLSAAVVLCLDARVEAASYFNLRKGVDAEGRSYVGRSNFSLSDGGVTATFKTPGVFSKQAQSRVNYAKHGLGVQRDDDARVHYVNSNARLDDVIRVRFSKKQVVNRIKLWLRPGSDPANVLLRARKGDATVRLPVTSDVVNASALGKLRGLSIRYVGEDGGVRLTALRTASQPAGTGGGGGNDDGDDDGNGGGGGDGGGGAVIVPVPASVWAGGALLIMLAVVQVLRRRKAASNL